MAKNLVKVLMTIIVAVTLGCEPKATDPELEKMCKNMLTLKGIMKGTDVAEATARVEKEYAAKEDGLKKEMARDLAGQDDVLVQKLKDIEEGKGEELSEEEATDLTPEQVKELQIKKANELIAKRKKEITDQFERLLAKLGPQKGYAIKDKEKYTKKRQKEANQALNQCIDAGKKKGVVQSLAACRAQAATKEDYAACSKK